MRPITPDEVAQHKLKTIPDWVFEVWNDMIAAKFSGATAEIHQEDIVSSLRARAREENVSSEDIFSNGWLDIEEVYRDAGWKVEYDKPAYCDNYRTFFTFRKPR